MVLEDDKADMQTSICQEKMLDKQKRVLYDTKGL